MYWTIVHFRTSICSRDLYYWICYYRQHQWHDVHIWCKMCVHLFFFSKVSLCHSRLCCVSFVVFHRHRVLYICLNMLHRLVVVLQLRSNIQLPHVSPLPMDVNPLLCTFPLPTSGQLLVAPRTTLLHTAPAVGLTRTTSHTQLLPMAAWHLPARLTTQHHSLQNRALVVAVEAVVVQ